MRAISRALASLLPLLLLAPLARAGGPRFVTGPPFFTAPAGQAIGWKQPQLLYYTDPGALSSSVDHQASDAIVAAAAAVWNLPVASITVAQGGALAEHVSGQNVYLDTSGLLFPADVMAANAAAIPISVIYDTDGSVTDLLLGSGASEPSACRHNGVTETVDSFDPAGYILHAILIVNGRCTAAAPAAQFELQYQLERAFGRVLGLAWSQTNDNVFTGTPTPTYLQALNWPIMHPLDIICGTYVYQCLPNPFQLRPDDISAMVSVYPVGQNSPAGKQTSLADAESLNGHLYFPTGEGMAGVNVLVTREPFNTTAIDSWYEASGVTGAYFSSAGTSPFVPAGATAANSFGSSDPTQIGAYFIAMVPDEEQQPLQNLILTSEPIDPLYSGAYSLGPYAFGPVTPSGSPISQTNLAQYAGGDDYSDFTIADAAPTCGNGEDGTFLAPMTLPATGWWNGLICGYGHASYVAPAVRPGRSFTIEVTALDVNGLATIAKAMPVIALFAPIDTAADAPSLGLTASAFNTAIVGMTAISASTNQLTNLTFGIADQRGDGRPDYNFQTRFFYADTLLPAELPAAGGNFIIAGSGFRPGNAVTINGVAATVVSWTANAIVVTALSMTAAQAANGVAVDVVVSDLSTGAGSTMSAALTYTTATSRPNILRLVSAPSGTQYVGTAASPLFAVQLLGPDGVTPVAGQPVVFTASAGSVTFSSCAAATCTLTTDSNGMASTTVTATAAGAVTVQAADGTLTQSAGFTAQAQAGFIQIWLSPAGNQPVGVSAGLIALTDRTAYGFTLPGRSITFTATAGSAIFSGCSTAVCVATTDSSGSILIEVTPTSIGPITIQAADGSVTSSFSFTSVSNTDIMQIATVPLASVYTGNSSGAFEVNLFHADGVTPDQNETVTFTASPGVTLYPCLSNVCSVSTGGPGQASVGISDNQPGTFTIQAAYGSITESASFTVVPHTLQLKIVTAPSGNVPLGSAAAVPFSAQLLQDGVTPVANLTVTLAAPPGMALLDNCGYLKAGCLFVTDSNGMVSTPVTPIAPGLITLNAVYSQQIATATFNATGPAETMTVTQQPGAAGVLVGDTINLAVQITAAGGAPYAGDTVNFSVVSGPFGFSDWFSASVNRGTDANGNVSEVGVAGGPGIITVLVADGVTSQTITFTANANPDQMHLISAPASGGYAGTVAPIPFSVQVLESDGVTVAANRAVTVSVTGGSASLSGCGGSPTCVLVTDSQGIITSAVTPLSVGSITLSASENGALQTATFTTIGEPAADLLNLASSPGVSLFVEATATSPFAVQVTLADGVTPVAGIPVVFSTSAQSTGAAQFGACMASACTVTTAANGLASTNVTGVTAGALTLVATAALPTGAATVTAPLQVVANQLSIAALNPATYIIEGALLTLPLNANAIENSSPDAGQAVQWTSTAGFLTLSTSTVTNSSGATSNQALLGPLAAGAKASTTACAQPSNPINGQTSVQPSACAEFDGFGVAASDLQLSISSGATQSVSGSTLLSSVVLLVQDSAGHPVASAPVNIYQTVTALDAACPAQGRCPVAPILASQATVAISAVDGTVTIAPLTQTGTSTQTNLAVSAGTQAFVTAVLTSQP